MRSPFDFLFHIVAQSHFDFIEDVCKKSRLFVPGSTLSFQIMTDEMIRLHKEHTRKTIYEVIQSKKFLTTFSFAKEIVELNMPYFKKAVLILLILDVPIDSIVAILLSSKESIMTTRSALKKSFPQYLSHRN